MFGLLTFSFFLFGRVPFSFDQKVTFIAMADDKPSEMGAPNSVIDDQKASKVPNGSSPRTGNGPAGRSQSSNGHSDTPLKLKISLINSQIVDDNSSLGTDMVPPPKPPTEYSLFFRIQQERIKSQQPELSFGEISQKTSEAWTKLDPTERATFRAQAETEKVEYLKLLAEYKAKLPSQPKEESMEEEEEDESDEVAVKDSEELEDDEDLVWDDQPEDYLNGQDNTAANEEVASSGLLCTRFGCAKVARESIEWDNEFCSADCVVKHCKFVFENYFAARETT